MKPNVTPQPVKCKERSCGRKYTPYRKPRAGETNRCPTCNAKGLGQRAAEKARADRQAAIRKMAKRGANDEQLLTRYLELGGREDTGERLIRVIRAEAPPQRAPRRTKGTSSRAGASATRVKAARSPSPSAPRASRQAPR